MKTAPTGQRIDTAADHWALLLLSLTLLSQLTLSSPQRQAPTSTRTPHSHRRLALRLLALLLEA